MTKRKIKLKQSLFEHKRNMTAPRGSANMQTQVSPDVEIELMQVIRNYNHEHNITPKDKKAPAIKHILIDFLNEHCIEQRTFKSLYMIMHVSKELDCDIIGFVDNDVELKQQDLFKYKPLLYNDYNFIYALASFNKENYERIDLSDVDGAEIFNIALEERGDFDSVREHLQTKHADINIDESYFVMFNLNNYLDILKDGVYIGENSTYSHEGVIVLIDPEDERKRVHLRINWSYSRGEIWNLQAHVEDKGQFETETLFSINNKYIVDEYFEIDKEPSLAELKERLESLRAIKSDIDRGIADLEQKISKCQ